MKKFENAEFVELNLSSTESGVFDASFESLIIFNKSKKSEYAGSGSGNGSGCGCGGNNDDDNGQGQDDTSLLS